MNHPATAKFPFRPVLLGIFSLIFVCMLMVTIRASRVRSVLDNGELLQDPWFVATLLDAYFGFFTFYLWVCWKETKIVSRLLWFVLIMLLGNFAMSIYVILQILRTPQEQFFTHLLSARKR